MRHWSHHHSTDTVDDPVFRAAMRGCDAVSFVFGLEVTWSLIQQRQQEEDEAAAATLLQEMHRKGQLCHSDDEKEDKPSTNPSKDNSDNEDSDHKISPKNIFTDLDASDTESSTDGYDASRETNIFSKEKKAKSTVQSSDPSCGSAQSDREAELGYLSSEVHETAHKEIIDGRKNSTTIEVTDSLGAIGGLVATAADKSNTAKWSCSVCTFDNKLFSRKCEICEAARPKG